MASKGIHGIPLRAFARADLVLVAFGLSRMSSFDVFRR